MMPANLKIKHQAQTAGGQLVDVGRLYLATAAAEVCIAYVVGHNEDDAGFACPASSLGPVGLLIGNAGKQQEQGILRIIFVVFSVVSSP